MTTNFKRTLAAVLLTLVGHCGLNAQDVQMATLQHGETMSTYYGADALKSAYEAAEAGDQICLSGGTFTSVNIEKVVKIYGAGAWPRDIANNKHRTILSGEFSIELPEGSEGLHIEGIMCGQKINCKGAITGMTLKKDYMVKLYFKEASTTDCRIEQCEFNFYPDAHSKNLIISNSYLNYLYGTNSSDAVLLIVNCVKGGGNGLYGGIYKNSAIKNLSWSANVSYYNCLIYDYYSMSENAIQDNVVTVSAEDWNNNVFTGYFELTDAFKDKVVGTDGTEIGIYGGSTPFSKTPSNPQVTTKEVASQSDNNGKLAVKMVVEAQQ